MRKALWIVPALLVFATVVAPCARADAVTFTCVATEYSPCTVATPTAPDVTFPSPTLDITWDSQTFEVTLLSSWLDTDSFSWFESNNLFIINDLSQPLTPSVYNSEPINTNSPPVNDQGGTLSFNSATASAPEPGTFSLMLIGLGSLGLTIVMRKRIAQCLPHAS